MLLNPFFLIQYALLAWTIFFSPSLSPSLLLSLPLSPLSAVVAGALLDVKYSVFISASSRCNETVMMPIHCCQKKPIDLEVVHGSAERATWSSGQAGPQNTPRSRPRGVEGDREIHGTGEERGKEERDISISTQIPPTSAYLISHPMPPPTRFFSPNRSSPAFFSFSQHTVSWKHTCRVFLCMHVCTCTCIRVFCSCWTLCAVGAAEWGSDIFHVLYKGRTIHFKLEKLLPVP